MAHSPSTAGAARTGNEPIIDRATIPVKAVTFRRAIGSPVRPSLRDSTVQILTQLKNARFHYRFGIIGPTAYLSERMRRLSILNWNLVPPFTLRMLFDWLITGQVVPHNPVAAVRGPKHVVKTGTCRLGSAVEAALRGGPDGRPDRRRGLGAPAGSRRPAPPSAVG
jgi:hypothetical protein